MSVIKFIRDIARYFKYPSDDQPTTQQDYQNAVKNWVATEESLVDCVLWQPTTRYDTGNVVKTPSIPSQYYLVCTTAGTSGDSEPTYTDVSVGDSVTDGSVTWEVSGYLPVTGGTMTGNIFTNSADFRLVNNHTNNSGRLFFMGGNGSSAGASAALFGSGYATANGYFTITASDGTDSKPLVGRPNGSLTWDNKEVLPQKLYQVSVSNTNVANNTDVALGTQVTIPNGTYVVWAYGMFNTGTTTTGIRDVGWADVTSSSGTAYNVLGQNAGYSSNELVTGFGIVGVSANTKVRFFAKQTSGATKQVSGGVVFLRLSSDNLI